MLAVDLRKRSEIVVDQSTSDEPRKYLQPWHPDNSR
jgi:hypothetical protein